MNDKDYLQTFDSDLIEHDFDDIDFFGEIMDDEERGHEMDNIQLNY